MSTFSVKATCLCGKNTSILQIPSSLPVRNIACHCNICRYTTGVLYLSVLPLSDKPPFADQLGVYSSSDKVSRYFCDTCGSHMLCYTTEDRTWSLCSGVADQIFAGSEIAPPLALETFTAHEFVGDTKDGGLSICFANGAGHESTHFFMQGPDEPPLSSSEYLANTRKGVSHSQGGPPNPPAEGLEGLDRLSASCHCGGIQFEISRPNEESQKCSSPWADLIKAYHLGSSENSEDVKWWLRGEDRFLAGTCTCRSCRLFSGVLVQAWAFIPKANIHMPDGSILDFHDGTLQRYVSSEGCFREFCNKCGATAFWHCEARPGLIDVSVGLLRAKEGSRASSWLEWWTERVSFEEDALDQNLAAALARGLHVLAPISED